MSKKNINIYMISTGAYSSYTVEYLAVHEKKFTQEEMSDLMDELKTRYINSNGNIEDYSVNGAKLKDILNDLLKEKGFSIGFPVGEFHLDDYGKLSDIKAYVPWRPEEEPSGLRIGVA